MKEIHFATFSHAKTGAMVMDYFNPAIIVEPEPENEGMKEKVNRFGRAADKIKQYQTPLHHIVFHFVKIIKEEQTTEKQLLNKP